jgi:hypothetical protein
MVIKHHLNISHDLSIASVGFFGHLCDLWTIRLEYPCWLRVQHERHC